MTILAAVLLAGLVPPVRPVNTDNGGGGAPASAAKACSDDGIQRHTIHDLSVALAAHDLDVGDVPELAALWLRPWDVEIGALQLDDGWVVSLSGSGIAAEVLVSDPALDENGAAFDVVLLSYEGGADEPETVLGLPLRVKLLALSEDRLAFVLDTEQDGYMPIPPLASFRGAAREGDGESRCACCNSDGPMDENDCTVRGCDDNSLCNGNRGQCKWVRHAGTNSRISLQLILMAAAVTISREYHRRKRQAHP